MAQLGFDSHDNRVVEICVDYVKRELNIVMNSEKLEIITAVIHFVKWGGILPALFPAIGHPPYRLHAWSRAILDHTVVHLLDQQYARIEETQDRLWQLRIDPDQLVLAS